MCRACLRKDIEERSKRDSVGFADQMRFLRRWWPVLGLMAMYSIRVPTVSGLLQRGHMGATAGTFPYN